MSVRDMIERVVERPIRDGHGAFAVIAVVLVAITVALQLGAARPEAPPNTAQATPTAAAAGPQLDQSAINAADAARVARRFLRQYLADLYGHRSAPDYAHATDALRRRLTAQRPRISPATRKRTPRIRRLAVQEGADVATARVVATIADGGPSTYPIGVLVRRTADGQLRVSDLLEAH